MEYRFPPRGGIDRCQIENLNIRFDDHQLSCGCHNTKRLSQCSLRQGKARQGRILFVYASSNRWISNIDSCFRSKITYHRTYDYFSFLEIDQGEEGERGEYFSLARLASLLLAFLLEFRFRGEKKREEKRGRERKKGKKKKPT